MLQHRSGTASPSPIVTGGGMVQWVEVATVTFGTVGAPHKRATIFRAMSATPGSGPITIQFGASQSNCQWIVSQWTSVDAGGVNGAGAIVQSGAARGDAVNGLTVSLAAFESAGNVAYGVFGVNARVAAVTPGGGFTEIAEHASAENPGSDLAAEWAPGDNSIDASWTALEGGALGIEIRVGEPPPPPVPVASVQVSPAAATVVLGGTVQLTATAFDASGNVLTGRAFTWQSDDNGVARVSANGLVTGLAAGPATITATAEGISGASDITVTAPNRAVDGDIQERGLVWHHGRNMMLAAMLTQTTESLTDPSPNGLRADYLANYGYNITYWLNQGSTKKLALAYNVDGHISSGHQSTWFIAGRGFVINPWIVGGFGTYSYNWGKDLKIDSHLSTAQQTDFTNWLSYVNGITVGYFGDGRLYEVELSVCRSLFLLRLDRRRLAALNG